MTAPDLSMYHAVHHAIRTAPHRLAAATSTLSNPDGAHPRQTAALLAYWRGYAAEVLSHHTVEDDIFFPALADRVPSARDHMARIDGDHHHLDELMDACGAAFEGFAAGTGDPQATTAVLRELAAHMDAHLTFEDEDLLPLFERHFTATEFDALVARADRSLKPAQLVFGVPFIGWSLPPAERGPLLRRAPRALRIVWGVTRGRHARLAQRALGDFANQSVVIPAGTATA